MVFIINKIQMFRVKRESISKVLMDQPDVTGRGRKRTWNKTEQKVLNTRQMADRNDTQENTIY